MLPRKALITAALIAALSSQTAHAKAIHEFSLGNWTGAAFADRGSGTFTHCAASASYKSGILVIFSVDADYRWSIGLAKRSWKLTRGHDYRIAFVIDGGQPIATDARAISNTQVVIDLQENTSLFQGFRHGQMLLVATADKVFRFALTDTNALLPSLVRCVARYRGARDTMTADANPFEKPRIAAPAANQFAAEATTMLANVLSAAKIEGFKFLGPSERGTLKNHAVWRGSEVLGTLDIYEGIDPKEITAVAPHLIASDAKSCNGTFLSGSIPGTTETPNARAFTTCQSGTTLTTVYYLAVQRKAGGIYVFSTASIGSETAAKEVDATLRRAVFQTIGATTPREASPAVIAK